MVEFGSDPLDGNGGESLLQRFDGLAVFGQVFRLDFELDAILGEMVLGESPLHGLWEGRVGERVQGEVDS